MINHSDIFLSIKKLFNDKKFTEAISLIDQLLKKNSNVPDAYNLRSLSFFHLKKYEQSLLDIEKALLLSPENFGILNNKSIILKKLNRINDGIQSVSRSIFLNPNFATSYNVRADLYLENLDFNNAVKDLKKAIYLNPSYVEAYNNLGIAQMGLKQYDSAIIYFDKSINLDHNNCEAYKNKAIALLELNDLQHSLKNINKAIEINPNFIEAYNSRGNIFSKLNRYEEALIDLQKAINLDSNQAYLFVTLGNIYQNLDKFDKAKLSFDKAIEINSKFAPAHLNKAHLLLRTGELDLGWKEYEWRWDPSIRTSQHKLFSQPLWLNNFSIKNKNILIHHEQGLGDTIQFCRFVPLLLEMGANVTFKVQPSLYDLLKDFHPDINVISGDSNFHNFDCHTPLLSLPLALSINLNNIPKKEKYLDIKNNVLTSFKDKIPISTKKRIGIFWNTTSLYKNSISKNISLAELSKIFTDKYDFFSLQKNLSKEESSYFDRSKNLINPGSTNEKFVNTGALCKLMDLVICIDTSIAHLAGALGCKTFVLIPKLSDFRWLLNRSDTPWYQSVKLFRQYESGNWDNALYAVKEEIEKSIS